jgi:DNA-binding NtrC family response regulator
MAKGKSILVVDDDESMLEFCATMLAYAGYEVHAAATGKQAISFLSERRFDVILTDHVTVDSKGTAMTRAATDIQPEAGLILMSGIPTLEEAARTYLQGADAYLPKPFNWDTLRRMVEHLMEPDASAVSSAA